MADIFLRSFPRVNKITASDLADYINQEYPAERVLYLTCHAAAMEVLIAGGYVMKYPADALSGGLPRYGLTQEGPDKSPAQAVPSISAADSAARLTQPKKDPASFSSRKRHPKTEVAEKPAVSGSAGDGASKDRNSIPNTEQKTQPLANVPPPPPAGPLQSTFSDNTEFKLLKRRATPGLSPSL